MKRISGMIAAALALAASPVAAQRADGPAAAGADARAVLDVVARLFDGMRAADSAAVRSVFHPEARLIRTGVRDGRPAVSLAAVGGFLDALGGATEVWDERLYDPEVRIDGNLASVWADYTFHRGDAFSHCGVDAFQLARTAEGWKIVSLADTARREGCEALLAREPWRPDAEARGGAGA